MKLLIALCVVLSISAMAATDEAIILTTPRGETLPINLHLPDGEGKVPLIIMAPGGNYHKDSPIFLLSAQKAVPANIAVLRMDWAHCKRPPNSNKCKGRYSDDLKPEAEDISTVVGFAQQHPRIDAHKIILSGKSLGSVVAYSVFQQSPDSFMGLALLTPICSSKDSMGYFNNAADENYPDFATVTTPVLMLLGNQDEATYLPHLWEWLAQMPRDNINVSVVGGDHSLLIDDRIAANRSPNTENLNLAIDSLVEWVKRTAR